MNDTPEISTTNGKPPAPGMEHGKASAPQPIDPKTGQHEAYFILSEAERAKGFVRPLRFSYKHTTCGGVTTMNKALSETYARSPAFYGATFCVACANHFPVGEFTWAGTTLVVGS